MGGAIQTGTVKGALGGALTGGLFGAVGNAFPNPGLDKTLAHGVVGGVSSAVQGGDFKSGFLSAGFAELAGPYTQGFGSVGNGVARMVVGGTASVLGGGKFENGAATAAFGYLFNHCVHGACTTKLEQAMYDWWPGYKAGTLLYNQTVGDGSWTGWEVLDAASVGLGAVGKGLQALQRLGTGNTLFKTEHYASRLASEGLNVSQVENVVGAQVASMRADMAVGANVSGRVTVDRVLVEYRARLLSNGQVNVGTIFPVK